MVEHVRKQEHRRPLISWWCEGENAGRLQANTSRRTLGIFTSVPLTFHTSSVAATRFVIGTGGYMRRLSWHTAHK